MPIALLTAAALLAFAANSVLARAGLELAGMGPGAFTGLRVLAGSAALTAALSLSGRGLGALGHGDWLSAGALMLYMGGFSFAYLRLDAGLGALILFAGVQVTMFAGTLMGGVRPGIGRWLGAGLGLTGLAILLAPGASAPHPLGAAMMALAALGWGVYSLRGVGAVDPLAATAGNFARALPLAVALWGLDALHRGSPGIGGGAGLALALASGALASGMGYAIWYAALPRLGSSLAAVSQLCVPVLALAGGVLFLGEPATLRFAIAALMVSAGVLLAVFWAPAPGKGR